MLLNRNEYLRSQLKKAFPFHSADQFNSIIQLYDLKRFGEKSTARDITAFVSRIGSIHRQWNDEIPLVQQAVYTIVEGHRTDIFNILSAITAPPSCPEELIGKDISDAIAAIHFNVPKTSAAHVLLSGLLSAALTSANSAQVAKLSKVTGFNRILEEVVMRNEGVWRNVDTRALTGALLTLDSLQQYEHNQSIRTAWQSLTNAARKVERWDPVNFQTSAAILLMIKRSDNSATIAGLLKSVGASLPKDQGGNIEKQGIERYIQNMKPVLELLPDLPQEFELTFVGSASIFVSLLEAIRTALPSKVHSIVPRLNTEAKSQIAGTLAAAVQNFDLHPEFPQLIEFLADPKFEVNWKLMLNAIDSLFSNNALQPGFQLALEATLALLNTEPASVVLLENLAAKGILYTFLF